MFGFAVAAGALSLRWWQLQRVPSKLPERAQIVYLQGSQADVSDKLLPGHSIASAQNFPVIDQADPDDWAGTGRNERQAMTGEESTP